MNNSNINIYQEAIQAVENGASFKIDFQTRSFKLNGKYVIKEGKYEGEGELGVLCCNEKGVPCKYRRTLPHLQTLKSLPNGARVNRTSTLWHYSRKNLCDDDMLYGSAGTKHK